MIRANIKLVEPSDHPRLKYKQYEGYLWGVPDVEQPLFLYTEKRAAADMYPQAADYIMKNENVDPYIAIMHTSPVRELAYTGPKTVYLKTDNSLYKVEVLDEGFSFAGPYQPKLGV